MHYPMDLVMSGGWFAAFALLVMYIHDIDCGGAFHWSGITHGGNCNQWKADEAFSFLSAIFWLCSALLVSSEPRTFETGHSNSFLRACGSITRVLPELLGKYIDQYRAVCKSFSNIELDVATTMFR
jgi:hypothetical protein